MTNIFLTGESGMLATAIKNNLPQGFKIYDFKDLAKYTNQYHFVDGKQVKDAEVDITDAEVLKEVKSRMMMNVGSNMIIHTAAFVNTDKCENTPYEAVKSNVYGTQLLIDLAIDTDSKFIHFSTTAVYDPEEYMKTKGLFNEKAIVGPKTIYGLTKYNSELAVLQSLPLKQSIVLQPVFIYGDAPNDNSSMIRKICERLIRIKNGQKFDSKLKVYLSLDFYKDYMRTEGFSCMFNRLLHNFDTLQYSKYIISRGQTTKQFASYLHIICTILDMDYDYVLSDCIEMLPETDYLKNHLGIASNFTTSCGAPFLYLPKTIINDSIGIKKTIDSIYKMLETL